MIRQKFLFFLLIQSFGVASLAQDSVAIKSIMTSDDFLTIVRQHHPLSKKADLQLQIGENQVRAAKGNLDPEAFTSVQQKYYSDQQYYSLVNAGLKIPTYIGVDFYGGLEQNTGDFLNPESNTSDNGLWYAGVSVPIGQGLFFDKRRAEIQKAKIYQTATEVERVQMLNELLYEAGKAYWNWFERHFDLRVYQEALVTAETRFEAVKQSASLGDRPSIDTLEAGIQVQNRMMSLQKAELDYQNAKLLLEVYLWADGLVPLELDTSVHPVELANISVNIIEEESGVEVADVLVNHPKLLSYGLKIDQFEVEQKWRREQLKPNLNLKYNLLTSNQDGEILNPSLNNYQWGLEFSMPIALRQERGMVKLNAIKIQEMELERQAVQVSLQTKAQSMLNELETTKQQVNLYQRTVRDYRGLLDGEVQKFELGESSLFMINSREIGYIQAQLKYIGVVTKNRKAVIGARYALGNLIQQVE